jgi:phage repressor protein C with HTH and peptisase S24 domain
VRIVPALFREVLRRFGVARLRVNGFSMWPAVRPGDVIHVRSVDPSHLTRGDVVLFVRHGALFAHRLIGRTGKALLTRGDAHWRADPPLRPSQVLGRVELVERGPTLPASAKAVAALSEP